MPEVLLVGGGFFLWTIVIVMFFKRFAARFDGDNSYRRDARIPTAEIVGNDLDGLTYADARRVFDTVPPAPER